VDQPAATPGTAHRPAGGHDVGGAIDDIDFAVKLTGSGDLPRLDNFSHGDLQQLHR